MSPKLVTRRYTKEEFAARGDAVYESQVRPDLLASDTGKFVAIDIESGQYVVDANEIKACENLRAKLADAQIWLVRIGSPFFQRFGGHARLQSP